MAYGSSQARGRIRAIAACLHHSHSNTRSELCLWPTPQLMATPDLVTCWARPGIEPASSWMLVRFVSAEPRWKLSPCPASFFFFFLLFRTAPAAYGASQARAESELWLPAYTTATAMPDPSHICNLHHSSWQHWILNPLSKARDRTCILMDTSWVRYHWATIGTPWIAFYIFVILTFYQLLANLKVSCEIILSFKLSNRFLSWVSI